MTPSRLPTESDRAYAAFSEYCRLGPQRSIEKVGRKLDKSRQQIGKWSAEFKWQERVAEYDALIEQKKQAAEDIAMKKAAAVWAKRQLEHRDKGYKLGEILVKEGLKRLKTISKATLGDICRAIQTGDNLQRLCLNLATGKTEISGPDNTPLAIQQAAPVVIVLEPNGRDTPKS